MKKVYATFRKKPLNQDNSLYSPSYFFNVMFEDYVKTWLTFIDDYSIDESQYNWELVPWVLKKNRLLIWYFNEIYVSENDFKNSLVTTWSEFHMSLFDTVEEVKQRIRDNTSLVEESDGKFILNEKSELNPETTYLIID